MVLQEQLSCLLTWQNKAQPEASQVKSSKAFCVTEHLHHHHHASAGVVFPIVFCTSSVREDNGNCLALDVAYWMSGLQN